MICCCTHSRADMVILPQEDIRITEHLDPQWSWQSLTGGTAQSCIQQVFGFPHTSMSHERTRRIDFEKCENEALDSSPALSWGSMRILVAHLTPAARESFRSVRWHIRTSHQGGLACPAVRCGLLVAKIPEAEGLDLVHRMVATLTDVCKARTDLLAIFLLAHDLTVGRAEPARQLGSACE